MRKWILGIVVLFAVVLVGTVSWPQRILPAVARWLDIGEQPQQVDAVFLLPGGPQTRPFVAAALVKLGLADRVLVPQNVNSPFVQDGILPQAHEITTRTLEACGIGRSQIELLEGRTSHTFGDALALRTYLQNSPDKTVAVVTSHFHTRRTRWSLRRLLGGAADRLHFVSAPVDEFTADDWWRTKDGLYTYGSEYVKLAFYLLRYDSRMWQGGLAVVGCVVLLMAASRVRRRRPGPRKAKQDDDV